MTTYEVYDWDARIRPQEVAFNPRGMSVQGPPTLFGRNQFASIDAGYWIAMLSGLILYNPETIKAYRALRANLEGGAHAVRVPVYDTDNIDTGLGVISVDGVQAVRSTLLIVDTVVGLEGGEYFSISDRLHLVRTVYESPTSLVIWPPLREVVPDNTVLNFAAPVCRMRLSDESSGDLRMVPPGFATPDMNFVEVF